MEQSGAVNDLVTKTTVLMEQFERPLRLLQGKV